MCSPQVFLLLDKEKISNEKVEKCLWCERIQSKQIHTYIHTLLYLKIERRSRKSCLKGVVECLNKYLEYFKYHPGGKFRQHMPQFATGRQEALTQNISWAPTYKKFYKQQHALA